LDWFVFFIRFLSFFIVKVKTDKKKNKLYYYNRVTKKSLWSKPDDYVEVEIDKENPNNNNNNNRSESKKISRIWESWMLFVFYF
jgi:hypothetical protein